MLMQWVGGDYRCCALARPSYTLEGVIGGGIAIVGLGLDFRVWGSMVLACRAMAKRCGRG